MRYFSPEVKFELAPLDIEAEYLYFFSRTEKRFSPVLNRVYPELDKIIGETGSRDEGIQRCREFAEKVIDENRGDIIKAKDLFRNDWDMVSKEFLQTLSEIFETEWPSDPGRINAYISIMPIFPRFLEIYSFCIGYKITTAQARESIAHEILHFLWFKKWYEVFPEIAKDQYESPNLTWRLSEIMDPIILQCQPALKAMIRPTIWGYPSFKELKIGDIGMTEYFVKVYEKCLQEGRSFEETLKVLWKEAQEHREVLERF